MEIKRHKKTEDLTGQVFGKLTVVSFAGYKIFNNGARKAQWLCLCECGNTIIIFAEKLKAKIRKITSCGCDYKGINCKHFKDLTKETLPNGIKAIRFLFMKEINKQTKSVWLFKCHCGNEFEANGIDVIRGDTSSCGCLRYKYGKDHHNYNFNKTDKEREIERNTPEYPIWRKAIYERDNHTCQCCGDDKGHNLNAHHIANWADNPELRYDPDNGVTLCSTCHKAFHKKYGYKNNNKNQLIEFLNN